MIKCEYSDSRSNKSCKEQAKCLVTIGQNDVKNPTVLSCLVCELHKNVLATSIDNLESTITYRNLQDIVECYLCHGDVDINDNDEIVISGRKEEPLYSHIQCDKERYRRFDKNLCISCGQTSKNFEECVYCLCCGEMHDKHEHDRKFTNFKQIDCKKYSLNLDVYTNCIGKQVLGIDIYHNSHYLM